MLKIIVLSLFVLGAFAKHEQLPDDRSKDGVETVKENDSKGSQYGSEDEYDHSYGGGNAGSWDTGDSIGSMPLFKIASEVANYSEEHKEILASASGATALVVLYKRYGKLVRRISPAVLLVMLASQANASDDVEIMDEESSSVEIPEELMH